MADQTIPDAAVQIAVEVLSETEALAAGQVARQLAADLTRGGWLHDPAEVAALRAVADAARAYQGDPSWSHDDALIAALAALDAVPVRDGAQ